MEDAECIARDVASNVIQERGFDSLISIRPLNSGGANFTSGLFELTVKKKNGEQIKLFTKVAIVSEKLRGAMNAELLYSTERLFYTQIVNIYNALQAESGVMFKFPEMFACTGDTGKETVVLEDLTSKGYVVLPRKASIDWKFAAAAVSKLAAFHALSFAFEKEHPEKFKAVADKLTHKEVKRDENMKELWGKIIKGGLDVVKEKYKEKMVNLLSDADMFGQFRKPIGKTVLVHGDYRVSNMLYKEQDNGIDIIVVDYQTIHSGSPVVDLLYLIFLGTDKEFRKNHYEDLIEHYHRELVTALKKLGVSEDVYTKEVYLDELKKMLPCALGVSVVLLPIVLVDEESAPKVAGDSGIDQFALAPTQGFAERFSDLVEDCADWGVL